MVDSQCFIDGEYVSITIDGNDLHCSHKRLEVHLNDDSSTLRHELENIGVECTIFSSAPYCTSFIFLFNNIYECRKITRNVLRILEKAKKSATY